MDLGLLALEIIFLFIKIANVADTLWAISLSHSLNHFFFFGRGRKPRKTRILILKGRIGEGPHRGRTPVTRRTEVAEE